MPDPKKKLNLDLSGYKEGKKLNLDLSGYSEVKKKVTSQPTSQEEVWGSNSQPKDAYTSLVIDKQIPQPASGSSSGSTPKGSSGLIGSANAFDSGLIKPTENYTPVNKSLQVANDAYDYALKNINPQKSLERYNDEVDQFQFIDGVKEGLKKSYNTFVGTPLNFINEQLGGDKDFKIGDYRPLQAEKEAARKLLIEEKQAELNVPKGQKAPEIKITEQEINKKAKEIFLKNDEQDQLHSLIDGYLPRGYDREGIWKELKLNQLRSNDILREKVASAEVFKSQISQFEEYSKKVDKKNPTPEQINKYNSLLEKAKKAADGLDHLSKNYDSLLKLANDDQEKLELFKYNYNDFEKSASLFYGGLKTIAGGATKLAGETLKQNRTGINPVLGQLLSDSASDVMQEGEDLTSPFYRYKATKLNSWSDLGSYATQLGSEQIPILGTIYLGGPAGTALVSMSSGGQKIKELEDEAKKPFGRIYSDGEKLAAGWLYAGAEFIPEQLGTARILKDLERTVSAASSASRKLFKDSLFKTTLNSIGKFSYNAGLEGTTELVTTEGQFVVDEELLGIVKTDFDKNEQRSESFFAGTGMGGSMSVIGGGLGFAVAQSKLYSDTKSIKEVQSLMNQIQKIKSEIDSNPLLTESETADLYKKMNSLNNQAFDVVASNANKGVNLSVREKSALLDINQKQKELKEKYNEVYNSNFSREIKNDKIKELKAEFDYQEQNRNGILNGSYNELTTISKEEKAKLKEQAANELTAEKIVANPELEGKEVVISDTEIEKRALENYRNSKEQTNEEVESAENQTTNEVVIEAPAIEVTQETTTEITPQAYVEELAKTKESDPETYWSVSEVSPEDAAKGTIIDTADGSALVKPDGDIAGLFKKLTSKAKGVAQDLLNKAVEAGGIKLDNFDGYLTKQYEKAGFRIVSRVPFSLEYGVPDGYNKEKHGTPDVVAMVYDPNNELDIEEKTFEDYDEAMAYRDSFVGQAKALTTEANTVQEVIDESEKSNDLPSLVQKAKTALSRILPGTGIILYNTEAEYKAAINEGADENSGGAFVGGKIHINPNRANGRTVAHEVFHAILLNIVKTDPEAKRVTAAMMAAIEKVLPADMKAKLQDFVENGYDAESDLWNEEKLAELVGYLAENFSSLSQPAKNIIKEWLDKLAKLVGLKEFTDKEVIDFMNTISGKIASGEVITEEDVNIIQPTKVDSKGNLPNPTEKSKNNLKAKRAQITDDTKSKVKIGSIVSTRTPDTEGIHSTNDNIVDLKSLEKDELLFIKIAKELSGYGLSKIEQVNNINDARNLIRDFKNSVKDNLRFLHDSFGKEVRDVAKLWYDGANKISNEIAGKYDYSTDQVAGVMAVLSPQMDWFRNLSLGKRVIDIYKNQQDSLFDSKMKSWVENSSSGTGKNKKPLFSDAKEIIKRVDGKKLSELDIKDKAIFIRAYDEMYNSKNYENISPNGEINGLVRNKNGSPGACGWGAFPTIEKSISILEDGSIENISKNLGNMHKVRNFFNNISNPNDPNAVTIDTHAVAAGLLLPLSGSSKEVLYNFGGASSKSTGSKGSYAVYADAYRELAKEIKILPRELQSITWEAVRGLFKVDFKANKSNEENVKKVWSKYKDGEISIDKAHSDISDLAGGISKPVWYEYVADDNVKLLDENSAAMDQANEDNIPSRKQIIGEKAVKDKLVQNNLDTAKEMEAANKSAEDIFIATGWEKGADNKWKYDLQEGVVEFKNKKNGKASEVINYPELFNAYPKAKNIDIVFMNSDKFDGMYLPSKNRIMLSNSLSDSELKSTLLHEVQHFIQHQEGFAVGGQAKLIRDLYNERIKYEKNFSVKKVLNNIKNSLFGSNKNEADTKKELDKLGKLVSKVDEDLYRSIAGEVEAFNVEKRSTMTAEERRATPISETAKVPVEEQLVVSDSDTMLRDRKQVNRPSADEIYEESNKAISDMEKTRDYKQFLNDAYRRVFERQKNIKDLITSFGNKSAKNAYNRLVTKSGASGFASFEFKEAAKKIYGGLKKSELAYLDKIIYAKRIKSINESRLREGRPLYKGMKGYSLDDANADLKKYESELGNKKFEDLNNRASEYFNEYRKSLRDLYDSGRISKETYEKFKNDEYSPIKTIKYILSPNTSTEEIDMEAKRFGMSKKDIMKLGDENDNAIIMDSKWLLATTINANKSRAFENKMLNEFNKAFEGLSKEEKDGVSDYIVENPVVGKRKDGSLKYKYDTSDLPNGFRKVVFFENGNKKELIMDKRYADQLLDVKNQHNLLKFIGNISGAGVLRFFATGGNPLFIFGNVANDFQNILYNTDVYSDFLPLATVQIARDFVKNFVKKALLNDTYNNTYKEYLSHGGALDQMSRDGLQALESRNIANKVGKGLQKGLLATGNFMSYLGNTSETAFRLAVYDKYKEKLISKFKKENGRNPNAQELDDIMWDAARESRETMPFDQGGDLAKAANIVMPYFNAALQGFRKFATFAAKNPRRFGRNILQYAAMSGTLSATSFAMLLTGIRDDEDDEEKSLKEMIRAWQSVSNYEKANYHVIFTGKKDSNGEYEYYRIKKLPIFSILSTAAEESILKAFLASKGVEYKFDTDPVAQSAIKSIPIPVTALELFSKNPAISAFMSYTFNTDTFTGEKIFREPKGKKILPEAEVNNKTNQVYKDLGSLTGLSPARSKVAIEKVITAETTNPAIPLMYSAYDGLFHKKDGFGKEVSNAMSSVVDAFGKKVVRYTNKDIISYKKQDELEYKEAVIETEIWKKEQKVYDEIKDVYSSGEKLNRDQFKNIIDSNFDKIDREKYAKKYKAYINNMGANREVLDIIFEDVPEVQAMKLNERYGNSFDEEERLELESISRKSQRPINKKAIYIYNEKYKNRKPAN